MRLRSAVAPAVLATLLVAVAVPAAAQAQPRLSASYPCYGNDESLLLNGSEPGAWVLLRGWSQRLGEHRVVFLKCSPSWPLRDVASSGLVQDFGLTRSECAVLDEFARLAKPLQIAERLNISISTVRSHLKQIHTKMAVNSSVQLIGITRAYTDD